MKKHQFDVDVKISFFHIKQNLVAHAMRTKKKKIHLMMINNSKCFNFNNFNFFFFIFFLSVVCICFVSDLSVFIFFSTIFRFSTATFFFQFVFQSAVLFAFVYSTVSFFKKISMSFFNSSMKNENLKKYIAWHVQRQSNMRRQLKRILHHLTKYDYDFQIIQNLKNVKNRTVWQKMHILSDIEIRLVKNVNKFHQIMKTQRKNRFSSISSWHSLKHSFFFSMISTESATNVFFSKNYAEWKWK